MKPCASSENATLAEVTDSAVGNLALAINATKAKLLGKFVRST